jgi:cell division protease FtsH
MQLPEEERSAHDRTWLTNTLCTLLGGRVAEEIVFQQMTTGAGNDIERVSDIARRMVCEWGMSPALGPIAFRQGGGGFLGDVSQMQAHSEMTAQRIDTEIKQVIDSCLDTASAILTRHNKFLHKFAEALLINETMDADEVDIVYQGYLKERKLERILTQNRGLGATISTNSTTTHEQTEDVQ